MGVLRMIVYYTYKAEVLKDCFETFRGYFEPEFAEDFSNPTIRILSQLGSGVFDVRYFLVYGDEAEKIKAEIDGNNQELEEKGE
jgi:hypothetical protein